MNRTFLNICALTLTTALVGCGGGGGDSSTPNSSNGGNGGNTGTTTPQPTPMTMEVENTVLAVDELSSIATELRVYDADQQIDVSIDYVGLGELTHSVESNTVSFDYLAPEIGSPVTEQFTVTINDKDDSLSTTFSININNTSANKIKDSIQSLIALNQSQSYFDELTVIAQSSLNLSRLSTKLTNTETVLLSDAFESDVTLALEQLNTIEVDGNYLAEKLAEFDKGALEEFELQNILDAAYLRVNHIAKTVITSLSNITQDTASFPPVLGYDFDVTNGFHSGYIGNSAMGNWVDGTWVFNADFHILQRILLSPCSSL